MTYDKRLAKTEAHMRAKSPNGFLHTREAKGLTFRVAVILLLKTSTLFPRTVKSPINSEFYIHIAPKLENPSMLSTWAEHIGELLGEGVFRKVQFHFRTIGKMKTFNRSITEKQWKDKRMGTLWQGVVGYLFPTREEKQLLDIYDSAGYAVTVNAEKLERFYWEYMDNWNWDRFLSKVESPMLRSTIQRSIVLEICKQRWEQYGSNGFALYESEDSFKEVDFLATLLALETEKRIWVNWNRSGFLDGWSNISVLVMQYFEAGEHMSILGSRSSVTITVDRKTWRIFYQDTEVLFWGKSKAILEAFFALVGNDIHEGVDVDQIAAEIDNLYDTMDTYKQKHTMKQIRDLFNNGINPKIASITSGVEKTFTIQQGLIYAHNIQEKS